jgi:hypothetical protein
MERQFLNSYGYISDSGSPTEAFREGVRSFYERGKGMPVLRGVKKIARYLEVSVSTVYKYIEHHNLPIRKMNGQQSAPIMTTTGLIDKWIEERLYNPSQDTDEERRQNTYTQG